MRVDDCVHGKTSHPSTPGPRMPLGAISYIKVSLSQEQAHLCCIPASSGGPLTTPPPGHTLQPAPNRAQCKPKHARRASPVRYKLRPKHPRASGCCPSAGLGSWPGPLLALGFGDRGRVLAAATVVVCVYVSGLAVLLGWGVIWY